MRGTSAGGGTEANTRNDIRLVLSDVDGTLLTDDKRLSGAAIAAVRDLRRAGILFAVTSARPPRGLRMLIEPLALSLPLASFNGGIFVDPDLSIRESHPLDPAIAELTLKLLLDSGLDAWVFTADDWLIRDAAGPCVARERFTVRFDATIVAAFTPAHLAQAVKIVGVSDDLDAVAACEKLAQNILGGRATAARSQPFYLDVTSPLANKGEVVKTLSRILAIPPAQIATIGDGPNDIAMFHESGFAIAMGNAGGAVKAQANAVTDSNEEDGFAKAMRRFIPRPGSG